MKNLKNAFNKVIVKKKNEKTIFFLFTCKIKNWKQKFLLSHNKRKIEKNLFSSYTKCTILSIFHRQNFILFLVKKKKWKKSLFFLHARWKIKKKFPFFRKKREIEKYLFPSHARCEIPHHFFSLRDHLGDWLLVIFLPRITYKCDF